MYSLFNLRICRCNFAYSKRALSTSKLKEYYALLKVDRGSTKQQIKDSFLKLSKIYHPDNKITGSHNEFVKLKEAYDAIKDGPPATSQSYSTSASNTYSNYDPYADLSHKAHTYHREQTKSYQRYYDPYSGRTSGGAGFGGPFANSSTPWEDLVRDKQYKRRKYDDPYRGKSGRPLISITLLLSGLAWLTIGWSINEVWKFNSRARSETYNSGIKEYKEYQQYLKRREAAREKSFKPKYGYYISKEAKKREEEAKAAALAGKASADHNSSSLNDTTIDPSKSKDLNESMPIEETPKQNGGEEFTNPANNGVITKPLIV